MKDKLFTIGIVLMLAIALGLGRISIAFHGMRGWLILLAGLLIFIIAIAILVIKDRRKK